MLILRPNSKKKPNNMGREELMDGQKKPLSLDNRNDGSQAHKVHKWTLRKANGPKGAQKEKQKSPWALCDVAK